ncbi:MULTISPECIES: PqqD family protein [Salinibacter]|uniref:PqqD family protein n=1 Tax=Salinibacter TaxID=146918 RepID=UPI0021688ED7|nr:MULTISPECIES: PqqD family protein [Salinibacter]MCS3665211.1 hypothetical protein [Salinibacter ruber]MCS3748885.1 hypothetical protein [Salinibacter ruber]MCS3754356.1 hypothetical protein [Salinibacter ruber]MCS3756074.1 hypothetical protein [Salinibacter ruber]
MVEHKDMTNASTVVASDGVTSTEIEGEHVLLDLDEGIYYGLNSVGGAIWKELQEPTSVEAIVRAITDAYDVGREECREDVLALLDDLQDNGLVDVREA